MTLIIGGVSTNLKEPVTGTSRIAAWSASSDFSCWAGPRSSRGSAWPGGWTNSFRPCAASFVQRTKASRDENGTRAAVVAAHAVNESEICLSSPLPTLWRLMNRQPTPCVPQELPSSEVSHPSGVIAHAQVEWLQMICRQVVESFRSKGDSQASLAEHTSSTSPSSRQPKARQR